MTLHAYECACEWKAHAQPDSFAVTGVWCAFALVANMPHAYDDPCRLAHAGTIQQANKCARGLKTHAHYFSSAVHIVAFFGRPLRLAGSAGAERPSLGGISCPRPTRQR
jgi:hypothetical protein